MLYIPEKWRYTDTIETVQRTDKMISYNEVHSGIVSEDAPHHFSAFASDLYDAEPNLRKGFPKVIETSIGNRLPLVASSKKVDDEGDVLYVRYVQSNGCISLIVYND